MLAKRIIPCLDVDRGRVVKGTKFLDLVDAGDPVAVAARILEEGQGIRVRPGLRPARDGHGNEAGVLRVAGDGGLRQSVHVRDVCGSADAHQTRTRLDERRVGQLTVGGSDGKGVGLPTGDGENLIDERA